MTGELLRLLQAQPELLAPGETARAEVMSLRQVGQEFQLLLRLTQTNGTQTQLQASASQPLPQGSLITVSQTDSNRLAVLVQQANASNIATLTRLDTRQVPVGTLLQGKVLTSQALPQPPGEVASFRSLVSLLNSSQAGATLTIDSPRPLPVGSLLSALVQGDQSLRFVPLVAARINWRSPSTWSPSKGSRRHCRGCSAACSRSPARQTPVSNCAPAPSACWPACRTPAN